MPVPWTTGQWSFGKVFFKLSEPLVAQFAVDAACCHKKKKKKAFPGQPLTSSRNDVWHYYCIIPALSFSCRKTLTVIEYNYWNL
jgi:hypothetical protein